MADQVELKEPAASPAAASAPPVSVKEAEPVEEVKAQREKKNTLKGMLMMAICCAAPLLLLAAIPFVAATFGSLAALGTGLLNIIALLACPVGMYLMMRMMMKDK